MDWVAGVDGCRKGWFVVVLGVDGSRVEQSQHFLASTFADVLSWGKTHSAKAIAVDIPIGLLDTPKPGGRPCDKEARAILGRRGCTVFSPAVRAQLGAQTFEEAKALGSITKQSFGILPKIAQVDAVLAATEPRFVYEVHPEVSFAVMSGGQPMRNKKSAVGRAARAQAIAQALGPSLLQQLNERPKGVGPDDFLDACAAAWTAVRIARGAAISLPRNASQDVNTPIWA
ncbi:MAG: DUF429 domain-containing protein [Chloroflexi bacterium]|nr:DUF429 domain-containing protein [Chloroflexota bacterium]